MNSSNSDVSLKCDIFGTVQSKSGCDKKVKRYTWTNKQSVSVSVITYGGTITSIKVPNKKGNIDDIVLGFDNVEGYRSPNNSYFGATVGRVANRIAFGKMTVDGVTYSLPVNNGPHHLHGGLIGFDKVVWDDYVNGNQLILTYHSADNEEGYPGDLIATVTFELTEDSELIVKFKAVVTKPCPVNLTNHSYFNLAGHGAGAQELYNHEITINADRYTEVDQTSKPTGNLFPVSNTIFDLRVPKRLGDVITEVPSSPGYDHNFCVTRASMQHYSFVAKAFHPPSGRLMEVYSDQPGVQFYTANFLKTDDSCVGKDGKSYKKHGACCFETQIYPDAVNNAHFPKVVLYPGEEYKHKVAYKFSVEK